MMTYFAVYSLTTGDIHRIGSCPLGEFKLQIRINEGIIQIYGPIDDAQYKVTPEGSLRLKDIPYASITDVISAIPDGDLDEVISRMLQTNDISMISQWKLDNYRILRTPLYPPITDYIDAQVKLSSNNPVMVTKGQQEITLYNTCSLAVKERFPKE